MKGLIIITIVFLSFNAILTCFCTNTRDGMSKCQRIVVDNCELKVFPGSGSNFQLKKEAHQRPPSNSHLGFGWRIRMFALTTLNLHAVFQYHLICTKLEITFVEQLLSRNRSITIIQTAKTCFTISGGNNKGNFAYCHKAMSEFICQ